MKNHVSKQKMESPSELHQIVLSPPCPHIHRHTAHKYVNMYVCAHRDEHIKDMKKLLLVGI